MVSSIVEKENYLTLPSFILLAVHSPSDSVIYRLHKEELIPNQSSTLSHYYIIKYSSIMLYMKEEKPG